MAWQPPSAMPRNFLRSAALHPMLRASDENALNFPPMYERVNWRDLAAYPQAALDEDACAGLPFLVLYVGAGAAAPLILHTGHPNVPLSVRDILVGIDHILFLPSSMARLGGAINVRAALPRAAVMARNTAVYDWLGGNSLFLGLLPSASDGGFLLKMES